MSNDTQIDRYKKLLHYINEHFKEDINIQTIEKVCHYSYRNINRIFQALHHETIGKHIKRIRLEKAAQYIKHSNQPISDIAFDVGYKDLAVFSKAFKKRFRCSPTSFRDSQLALSKMNDFIYEDDVSPKSHKPLFEIETLPDFYILGLEYKGSYQDLKAIEKTWKQLVDYATSSNLITKDTLFLAEILDDDDITEDINCRYTAAIILDNDRRFQPKGLFTNRLIKSQKYAKFIHKGSHETCDDTYNTIYSQWIQHVNLEMYDAPTLEFYLNDESDTAPQDLLTEIYIPIA